MVACQDPVTAPALDMLVPARNKHVQSILCPVYRPYQEIEAPITLSGEHRLRYHFAMKEVFLIPFDQLWSQDISVVRDQLYSVRAIRDPEYARAIEAVIEAKQEELDRSPGYAPPKPMTRRSGA